MLKDNRIHRLLGILEKGTKYSWTYLELKRHRALKKHLFFERSVYEIKGLVDKLVKEGVLTLAGEWSFDMNHSELENVRKAFHSKLYKPRLSVLGTSEGLANIGGGLAAMGMLFLAWLSYNQASTIQTLTQDKKELLRETQILSGQKDSLTRLLERMESKIEKPDSSEVK